MDPTTNTASGACFAAAWTATSHLVEESRTLSFAGRITSTMRRSTTHPSGRRYGMCNVYALRPTTTTSAK